MIEFTPGTAYYVEHLRPFDLELALAGHPLATPDGKEVRLFRFRSTDSYLWDYWSPTFKSWIDLGYDVGCPDCLLYLAPLTIKDGRPLHVGDEVEVQFMSSGRNPEWVKNRACITGYQNKFYLDSSADWRWPESAKTVNQKEFQCLR